MSEKLCLALGDFDGVHKGHQRVISAAVENSAGLIPAVYTFDINSKGADVITDNSIKTDIFKSMGIKRVIFEDFGKIKDLSAKDFVESVLADSLNAQKVVCGMDFTFGKNACGNVDTLKKLCKTAGIEVIPVTQYDVSGVKLSSSDIRVLISNGEMEKAEKLLGHRFAISGKITHGKGMASEKGVPTLNIDLQNGIIRPLYGVYATETVIDGKRYRGITNVGIRPSVEKTDIPNSETHLFEDCGDVYSKYAVTEFIGFIRKETVFNDIDLLFKQIEKDIQTAKNYFNGGIE